MAYTVCKIKNLTGEITVLNGHTFQIAEVYTIQDSVRNTWAHEDNVLQAIADGDYEVHNGDGAITGLSNQIDWLKKHYQELEATIEHTSRYSMKADAEHVQCAINGTTNIDIKLQNFTGESYADKYLKGGELFGDNIEYGDYCRFFICDVDNILGYGAGLEIKSFIEKAYVKPAPCPNHFGAECPAKIPVGLYLRCAFTAVNSGSAREIFINYDIQNKD